MEAKAVEEVGCGGRTPRATRTAFKHIENFDDSVPVDVVINKEYSKAYYYELDNTAYTEISGPLSR